MSELTFGFFLLQSQGLGAVLFQMLPFLLIIPLFYFLILQPQRKRQQEIQQLHASLKVGDKVVTNSGLIGLVTALRDDNPRTVQLRICETPAVRIDVLRSSIAGLHTGSDEKK